MIAFGSVLPASCSRTRHFVRSGILFPAWAISAIVSLAHQNFRYTVFKTLARQAGVPSKSTIGLLAIRIFVYPLVRTPGGTHSQMCSMECWCRQRFVSAVITERIRTMPTPIKRPLAADGAARSMEARNRMTGSYQRPANDRTISTHPGSKRSGKRPARVERRPSSDQGERP